MNSRTEVIEEQNELHLVGARPQDDSQQEQQQPQPKKKQRPRVRWSEDTVDNEDMGKKKSKICCIFHPQRSFDEESDDCHSCSSSSSDSDSDTDSDSDSGQKKVRRSPSPNAYEYQPKYKNKSQLPPEANKPETS